MNDNTLKTGSLLKHGEYNIIRVLGQGGFGITYEADQVSLGRKVAVKEFFMKDSCERDESTSYVTVPTASNRDIVSKFRDKFLREARMIAALDHDHIVKIHDVFEENGTAYYVMEYLGGGSLDRKIKDKGAMPEDEAVGFIRQIADALSYLHSQNILHFDVKPSNVLLGKNGSAKLIDFGISKHYDEAGHQTSSTPVGISKGYAPLEQYQQGSDIKSFTPASDIYSLGATLFALLTGSIPPEASLVGEEGLPAKPANVSFQLWNAVEQSMSFRRKDRPQSVGEFLAILNDTARENNDEQTVVPVSKPIQAPKHKSELEPNSSLKSNRKTFPKWLYGLIAGVAVVVLSMVLFNRSGKTNVSASKPVSSAQLEMPSEIELQSISLSKTSLALNAGNSTALTVEYTPGNATNKATIWKSSDVNIVKVSANGLVTAIKEGSATIIAYCQGKDAFCNVTVNAKNELPASAHVTSGSHNGYEWVDLGLSVKWATTNVGALSPEEYGSYFAWGETSPKNSYDWTNVKYRTKGDDYENVKFSKYVSSSTYGPVDNRSRLELNDDAARQNWGGNWRMPTINEFQELIEKCSWTWTEINGKNGYKVKSKLNGKTIFLPAAGWKFGTSMSGEDFNGHYWASSRFEGNSCGARSLDFDSDLYGASDGYRRDGRSVRPVLR